MSVAGYERDAAIHGVFRTVARAAPQAIAVASTTECLTYAELEQRSNDLAGALQALGVRAGSAVGVALERSAAVPVALLAILKSGAAYVPLDANYPPERVAFICRDAALEVTLTDARTRAHLASAPCHFVTLGEDEDHVRMAASQSSVEHAAGARDRAYVMYTSGSTGRPKGVQIAHRGVVRLVRDTDYVDLSAREVMLHAAPLAFDASTFEIWGALLNGGCLAIPQSGLLSIEDLCAAVERFAVTTMFLTPALFDRLVESGAARLHGLRQLILGGDVVAARSARLFLEALPGCRLVNGYGPTENTTFSTAFTIAPQIAGAIPIGKAIAHSSAYILGEDLSALGPAVPGELYVGGDGVALGYLNLPELTRERFIADPFSQEPEALLYRTGDRAMLRADGVIEFLGRNDDQVKVRGFRVELGEIESVLRAHPAVGRAAAVTANGAGEKTLFAFIVPLRGVPLDEPALREYLRAKLPAFMLPHHVRIVAELPELASGKLDRRALRDLAENERAPVQFAAVPQRIQLGAGAAIQRTIAEVWREVLDSERSAGLDENFFDVGGDSLRLLTVHARLRERLSARLSLMDMFENSTIRKLAAAIQGARAT